MDFTVKKYADLLDALKRSGIRFELRHDVDLLPNNSLRIAQIESLRGLSATYYFRIVPESYNEKVIKEISHLGHKIGYHYESLTTCNGDLEAAYQDFCQNLERLRRLAPITRICMHGSPRSQWDSKDIWKQYDYHSLGIDYEPYFDTDFSKTLYLTDTGRRWDGYHVSVRDKIPTYQEVWEAQGLIFHTTDDIIVQLDNSSSPLRQSHLEMLITTHPQRWNPFGVRYTKELVEQTAKNWVKGYMIKRKTIQDKIK